MKDFGRISRAAPVEPVAPVPETCRLLRLSEVSDGSGVRTDEDSPVSQKAKEAPKSH